MEKYKSGFSITFFSTDLRSGFLNGSHESNYEFRLPLGSKLTSTRSSLRFFAENALGLHDFRSLLKIRETMRTGVISFIVGEAELIEYLIPRLGLVKFCEVLLGDSCLD